MICLGGVFRCGLKDFCHNDCQVVFLFFIACEGEDSVCNVSYDRGRRFCLFAEDQIFESVDGKLFFILIFLFRYTIGEKREYIA